MRRNRDTMASALFVGNWRLSDSRPDSPSRKEQEPPFLLLKESGSFHSAVKRLRERRSDGSFLSAPEIDQRGEYRGSSDSVSSESQDATTQSGSGSSEHASSRNNKSFSNRSFADFEKHNEEEAISFKAANLLHPSESILVHPEARPYAQLCYNPHLGTLTTLLVGNKGPYSRGSMPKNAQSSTIVPKILTETQPGHEMVEIVLSTSISSSSSPCTSGMSESSSETDESGWSTGEDSSFHTAASSGSDQLVEAIMWIDEEWMETSKKDYYLYEQGQSLLQPQDPVFTPGPVIHQHSCGLCFPCPCRTRKKASEKKRATMVHRKRNNKRSEEPPEDVLRYATLLE